MAHAVITVPREYRHGAGEKDVPKADAARTSAEDPKPSIPIIGGSSTSPKVQVLRYRVTESPSLTVRLVNNIDSENIRAYISGLDADGKVFFVRPGGDLVYPKSKDFQVPSEITEDISLPLGPLNNSIEVPVPSYIQSGRVYFADAHLHLSVVNLGGGDTIVQPSVTNVQDPNANINWGFVELTYMDGSLYANISYVDFVGIVLGMKLIEKDGSTQTTAGLVADAVTKICDDLSHQSKIDGRDWKSLCVRNREGKVVRVLSPGNRHDVDTQVFAGYWNTYVNRVWREYTEKDLIVNTQSSAGHVKCRVTDNQLLCEGSNRGFTKPSAKDIFGCDSGPFAIVGGDNPIHSSVVPRLCAAFVRSTLLLEGGDTQPGLSQSSYYTVSPTNHYSRIVHSYEVDGRGYAFPYDDVNPDGKEDASGVVSSNNVQSLMIHVGGPAHGGH
ncbi:hypothetical protein ACHAO7_010336 [Fusarium culmorum]